MPVIKGRGTARNPEGRFEPASRPLYDLTDRTKPRTQVMEEQTKGAISRNESPDIPFSRSVNPYRGCEHGCVYCFARPSHEYLGHSAGLDFETKLYAKQNIAAILQRQIAAPSYKCSPIALGANTDPYQPIERDRLLTRDILSVLATFDHPVTVITKSALVCRDLDLLAAMAEKELAMVSISLTTLNNELARALEPRAATPAKRLEAIRRLSEVGIPVAVLTSPMIPGLNDHELERLLEAARNAGARSASYVLIRLPHGLAALFEDWLKTHRPRHANKVMSLIRQCRDGGLSEAKFGARMRGSGPVADMIATRFAAACKRLGLSRGRPPLDTSQFRAPVEPGLQLSLFDDL